MQSNQSNNSNSNTTPLQNKPGADRHNLQNSDQVVQLTQQLISELSKQGGDENLLNQQFPSSNQRRNADSNQRFEDSNYNYYEVEQQIINQIQQIKANADSYGPVVDVVARRSIVADSDGRGNGYEYEYQLSDGRIVSNDAAWELANAGKLNGVVGSHNHGRKYIRNVGDGNPDNNLGNLPTF